MTLQPTHRIRGGQRVGDRERGAPGIWWHAVGEMKVTLSSNIKVLRESLIVIQRCFMYK